MKNYSLVANSTYTEDSISVVKNIDFLLDKKFASIYNSAVIENYHVNDKIRYRAYIAVWAGVQASNLKGDFVEAGVNKGFLSKIIMDYLNFKDLGKHFYLLDTYEGIPENTLTQEEIKLGKVTGGYKNVYDFVLEKFGNKEYISIIKGMIPDTLEKVESENIAYLSIDMNNVTPEIATINFFWDKLVSGAIILLDDYGFLEHTEQYKAFNNFADDKGLKVLPIPTGQGLIIKP